MLGISAVHTALPRPALDDAPHGRRNRSVPASQLQRLETCRRHVAASTRRLAPPPRLRSGCSPKCPQSGAVWRSVHSRGGVMSKRHRYGSGWCWARAVWSSGGRGTGVCLPPRRPHASRQRRAVPVAERHPHERAASSGQDVAAGGRHAAALRAQRRAGAIRRSTSWHAAPATRAPVRTRTTPSSDRRRRVTGTRTQRDPRFVHAARRGVDPRGRHRRGRRCRDRQLLPRQRPGRWQHDVPTYGRVRAAEVYPGIDVVYYGNQRQLQYDFEVAPRRRPVADCDRVRGRRRPRIDTGWRPGDPGR